MRISVLSEHWLASSFVTGGVTWWWMKTVWCGSCGDAQLSQPPTALPLSPEPEWPVIVTQHLKLKQELKGRPVWGQRPPQILALLLGVGVEDKGAEGVGVAQLPSQFWPTIFCPVICLCSPPKAPHTAPPQIPSLSNSNSASSVTNYLRNGVAIREQILAAPPSMERLDLRLSTSFPVRQWVLPRVWKEIVNGTKGSQPTSQLCGWWHTLNVLNGCCNIRSVIMSVQEDVAYLRPWSLQSASPYNSLQRKKYN